MSLETVKTVSVKIIDRTAKVSGTEVKMETLPQRRSDMTREAIMIAATKGPNKDGLNGIKGNIVIQAQGTKSSLDLRHYQEESYDSAIRAYVKVPSEKQKTYEKAESLFMNTVRWCFEQHYGLGIRPDVLMWMVLHEIGITVKQNADFYRHLFTTSKEKQNINIHLNSVNIRNFEQADQWAIGIGLLNSKLKEKMPSNLIEFMLPKLSTHDLNSETASMIAVLDAASPFYSYTVSTCCGIPSIKLFGKGEDYDAIVEACKVLHSNFSGHLDAYFKHLIPVLMEIADTANNRKETNQDFWKSIYGHLGGSGRDDMSGWATAFINYVSHGGVFKAKFPGAYDVIKNIRHAGIPVGQLPHHVSSVPFIWNYCGTPIDCRFMGGVLAVEEVEGHAVPTLSWAVVRGDIVPATVNPDGTVTALAEGQDPVTY